VAEGTSLLRMHTAYTCIVSSNLTVSAMLFDNFENSCHRTRSLPVRQRVFCCLVGLDTGLNTASALGVILFADDQVVALVIYVSGAQ
jgi:hypothetical protein